MVVNYNPPVSHPTETALYTTYVQRVCSSPSGRLVINLWVGQAEGNSIAALEHHFNLEFATIDEHDDLRFAVWQAGL